MININFLIVYQRHRLANFTHGTVKHTGCHKFLIYTAGRQASDWELVKMQMVINIFLLINESNFTQYYKYQIIIVFRLKSLLCIISYLTLHIFKIIVSNKYSTNEVQNIRSLSINQLSHRKGVPIHRQWLSPKILCCYLRNYPASDLLLTDIGSVQQHIADSYQYIE